mmetsp:Transcript_26061/g.24902  ORF Transcript_26061/g.24902 Transcript_26061/m.24902 type:complete len:224 (-) Transcript_26061:525-1196(-)|eukprot:CAMPEP_0119033500 /NCGR_PEP_ID=MMETSP1177-20130426/539_1 /TAXON_ID=2985 /ORGANISM="Ochromonas sp, Strain CCMP1899" /LENGTH=223 /DNA_ID=CAMNT_0006990281 /DNA_START=142 /DNA_END=813 /DNA_ORIENTATION=+
MFSNFCIFLAVIAVAKAVEIELGECKYFAVHGGAKVAFNGGLTTIHTRNVGMSPGSSITGHYIVSDGSTEIVSTSANTCADDRITAYNAIKSAQCTVTVNDIGGQTLDPGVYCDAGAPLLVSSDVTLVGTATDIFIFQATSSLLTSLNSKILLEGVSPQNVYWAVGSSATIGTDSTFTGTLITYASISIQTNAVMNGQALAGAAVTFQSNNQVTNPYATKNVA